MTAKDKIEELEQYLRSHEAGSFIDAVAQDGTYITLSLSSFRDEPELLYRALEYASYKGRDVYVTPLLDEHLAA